MGKRIFLIISLILLGCEKNEKLEREMITLPEEAHISQCKPGRRGGILILSSPKEMKTFNYLSTIDNFSENTCKFLFSAIVEFDLETETITPGLAKSWKLSSDNKSYTFALRKGVCWSDGKEITVDDIIFTFDTIFDKRYPNKIASFFKDYDLNLSCKKISDTDFTITTDKPFAPLLYYLSKVYILPKHALAKHATNGKFFQQWTLKTGLSNPDSIICSGPFCIKRYMPGERLVFKANPHYWKVDSNNVRLPYLDYLITQFVHSSTTQTMLFLSGETDAAPICVSDYDWISSIIRETGIKIHGRSPADSVSVLCFNQDLPEGNHKLEWFKNENFRRAIAHCINRNKLINAQYLGHGEELNSFVPVINKWYCPEAKNYAFDLKKSEEHLISAGFQRQRDGTWLDANKNVLEIELILSSQGGNEYFASSIHSDLTEIGIKVKVRQVDEINFLEIVKSKQSYEAAILCFSVLRDPCDAKELLKSNGHFHVWSPLQNNPASKWESKVDELFDMQAHELDTAVRKKYFDEIQMILSKKLPMLYLVSPRHFTGIKKQWQNVRLPKRGSIIWNIEEIWRKEE